MQLPREGANSSSITRPVVCGISVTPPGSPPYGSWTQLLSISEAEDRTQVRPWCDRLCPANGTLWLGQFTSPGMIPRVPLTNPLQRGTQQDPLKTCCGL